MVKSGLYLSCFILFSFSELICAQQIKKNKLDFSYLDRKINGWIDAGYYKGASILIAKDHHIIHQKYYGNYNPKTIVFVASAGKWLAAATIAAVVDDGNLSWDDKVKKWIPEFRSKLGEASLRQLLSHTAGFPDYQPNEQHPDDYQTLKESVAHILDLKADTLPGTKFKYGGLAMQVAGRMAELAAGKDWESLFQLKIAKPLNMEATHFTPVDQTSGHNPMLGGGLRTNLQDYANFLDMISRNGVFNGKRILSEKAIAEMQADQIGNASMEDDYVKNVRASERKDVYGLGEWREEVDSTGRASLISSPGWAGTYPWIDYKNQVYGFFLTHIDSTKNGFNSFLASPVLPYLIRDVLDNGNKMNKKSGYIYTSNHAKLYYEESGRGEPIILIHGHSFDHSEWKPQFFEFAKKHRVISYDVRGYGWSGMPVENQKALHADDLYALMKQLKIDKAHVLGLSLGGFIATDFLALHPEKLLSVTMASGDIFDVPGPNTPWSPKQIATQHQKIKQWQANGIQYEKLKWFNVLTQRNGINIKSLREPVWNMIYKWDAWQPQHVEPRYLLGNEAPVKLKALKINVPILVLTGEFDRAHVNDLLKILPGAKQLFVKDAGHVSNLENPIDFNKKYLSFLHNLN